MTEGSPVRRTPVQGVDSNIPGYVTDMTTALPALAPVIELQSPIQGPANNPLDIDALIAAGPTPSVNATVRIDVAATAGESSQPGQYPYPGIDRYTNLARGDGDHQRKTEQANRPNPSDIDELIYG